jgi:hypothetical protein
VCMKRTYPEIMATRPDDHGRRGSVWIHSGGTDVIGNVVTGMAHAGFERRVNSIEPPRLQKFEPKFPASLLRVLYATTPSVQPQEVPGLFDGNTVYGITKAQRGLDNSALTFLVGLHAFEDFVKDRPLANQMPKHLHSNLTAWQVGGCIFGSYSGLYRFFKIDCDAGPSFASRVSRGLDTAGQGGNNFEFQDVSLKRFREPVKSIGTRSTCEQVTVNGKPFDCRPFVK